MSTAARLARAIAAPVVFFQTVAEEIAKQRRLTTTDPAGWSFLGTSSTAGKSVTLTNALKLATVWACIRVNAQAASSLPLVFRETQRDGTKRIVSDDRFGVAEILGQSPNADQTPLEFWETQIAWLLCRGNAYAEKVTSPRGRLQSLEVLRADLVTPRRLPDNTLVYEFRDRGKIERLPRSRVMHLKGFGQGLVDRDLGLSPIAAGANVLGAAMAADESAARFFSKGMQPSGFFKFDTVLSPEDRELARENLIKPMTGSGNTGSVGILEGGTSFDAISLNPEDAQLLETRAFNVEEICRLFGTPPIIIGHAPQGQTMWGSGVEQVLLSWLTLGIDPICDRIEARIHKDLLRGTGQNALEARFDREALLQMDSKAKADFLSRMVQNGIYTRGEARERLHMPRREGTDTLTAQTNLAPLNQLGQVAAASGGAAEPLRQIAETLPES